MSTTYDYIPITTDDHAAQYARILAHSFGRLESESTAWLERFGRESCRVLIADGRAVAGLIAIRMGQFFGGRRIDKIGVAAVGAAPEARGRGVATELMRRCILETHEQGIPISGLYPATQKLYRAVGYEQSGHRFEVRVPLGSIGIKDYELKVRPIEEADRPRVYALYAREAQNTDGNLDRPPILWDRIERPPPSRVDPARAFVIEGDGGAGEGGQRAIEGYVYLTQVMPPIPNRGKHEVHVHDMLAATPRAARRLWSFLAGYATLGPDLQFYGGPTHPLLATLPEQPYRMSNMLHWMTRIVHVDKALESRGYPAGLRAALVLNVKDSLIPANSGFYLLEVNDGRATVSRPAVAPPRGAAPMLTCSINGLATLYTAHLAPAALRSIGFIDGDNDAIRAAAAIFAGSTPWMSDMY